MTVTKHTCSWIHTCKNGSYHYFTCLCPAVISNSISMSEYWNNYPMLNISPISRSSALILVHIIENNFNSAVLLLQVPQIDSYCTCAGDVRRK